MQERKSLPLAKASAGGLNMPDASAIEKLFSVSTTLEVAEYFRDRLSAQAKSCGLNEQFQDVMTEVDKFVGVMQAQTLTSSNYWSGDHRDAAVSVYRVFHQNLSKDALKALEREFPDTTIHFDFAMNDVSELVQGFSTADGNPLAEEETAQMNQVYSAWLVEHGKICEDGVIYNSAGDGTIKTDQKGEKERVKREEYIDLIMDPKEGIAESVLENTESLKLIVTNRSDELYPDMEQSTSSSR